MIDPIKHFQKEAIKIPDDPKKIAIVGLRDAGKTSLLKNLFHQFDEIHDLNPTRKVERSMTEFLHHPLSIWDFGGQTRYTQLYLKNQEMYFKKIAQLFYVVDCQNSRWIQESITYFEEIIAAVYIHSPDTQITIIYNKIDPDFENVAVIEKNILEFKESAIKILNERGFGYQGYRTSKDVPIWVMTAFSKSMLDNPHIFNEVSQHLKDFTIKYSLDAALVFTKHGFGLGHYFSEELQSIEVRELFIKFFTKFDEMYNLMPIIDLQFQGINIFSTRMYLDEENHKKSIFFGFIYKNQKPTEKEFGEFLELIRKKIAQIV